jgi:LPS O-antigen subunit length determinant protein (WzzB/FepE family)
MDTKKIIQFNDEINLANLFYTIWINKLKIISISILSMLLMFGYLKIKEPAKVVYNANSNIMPISSFEESNYDNYNYSVRSLYYLDSKLTDGKEFATIDKIYLQRLFLEKLKQESYLESLIKKSKYINKNNYKSDIEYENEVSRLSSNISLTTKNHDKLIININVKTNNKEYFIDLLNLIEKDTNLYLKNYIKKNFDKSLLFYKDLKRFRLEKLKRELFRLEKNSDNYNDLLYRITRLEENRQLERIEELFALTPFGTGEFYAAKVSKRSIIYRNITGKTNEKLVIALAGIVGALLVLIFVILRDKIKKNNI